VNNNDAEILARKFHETYERLAPNFGYETKTNTKTFNPDSANGKLMIAVCSEIIVSADPTKPVGETPSENELIGKCPICGTPVYTAEGFCGVCGG